MKLRGFVMAFAVLAVSSASVFADTIIRFDTEGVGSGTPTVTSVLAVDPGVGVIGIDVTRGSGLTPASASFAINSSGWADLSPEDYYEFGFMTTTPYDLDNFTVGLRSSNTGPGFVNLLYSVDGGAFTLLSSVDPIALVGTDFNNLNADLSEIGQVNSSLIFRIMAANHVSANGGTIGAAGTFRFGSYSPSAGVFLNAEIAGEAVSVQAVPESGAAMLVGIGVAAMVLTPRLRARKSARKA